MRTLINYAMQFVGTNYRWGGDDPIKGFDCSGFVQEILASVGEDPPGDQTSHSLWLYFKKHGHDYTDRSPEAGCLIFGGNQDRISHVAFCLDEHRMIEAGGGARWVDGPNTASIANAFIRIRQIDSRSDLVSVIKPDYKNLVCE